MNMEVTTLDIIHDCRNLADSEDVEAVVTSLQRQVGIDGCILGFRERYGPRLVEDSCITSFGISSSPSRGLRLTDSQTTTVEIS